MEILRFLQLEVNTLVCQVFVMKNIQGCMYLLDTPSSQKIVQVEVLSMSEIQKYYGMCPYAFENGS